MIPYSLNPMGINTDVALTDLDILRQIRDANPTSQLPTLWLDTEDPYTQWEGVAWTDGRVSMLTINVRTEVGILRVINLKGLDALVFLDCNSVGCEYLNVEGLVYLTTLNCGGNKLTSIPSLVSKGAIVNATFKLNLMPPAETDRLLALGFTTAQVLPQDI